MFKTYLVQHFHLSSSPTGNSLLALAEAHFFQSLGDTVLNVLPSLVVTDRNVVDVQVGSCFVHVQDSVKNVKVWVAILETFHVLFQAVSHKLKVLSAVSRIFHLADLHNVLIKALTFVGSSADSIAGLHAKKVFIVAAVDHTIISFLPSIISFSGFSKKLIVCFAYRLTHEGDVLRSAERINIFHHELPVIVS